MKLTKLTLNKPLNVVTATFRTFWGTTMVKTIFAPQIEAFDPFWLDTGEIVEYPLNKSIKAFVDMEIEELIIK